MSTELHNEAFDAALHEARKAGVRVSGLAYSGPAFAGEHAERLAALEEARQGALANASALVMAAPPGERDRLLGEITKKISAARSVTALSAVLAEANAQVTAAANESGKDRVENAEAGRAEQLKQAFEKIERLEAKVSQGMDELWSSMSPDEQRSYQKAKEAEEKAKKEKDRVENDPNATEAQKQAARNAYLVAVTNTQSVVQPVTERIESDPTVSENTKKTAHDTRETSKQLGRDAEKAGSDLENQYDATLGYHTMALRSSELSAELKTISAKGANANETVSHKTSSPTVIQTGGSLDAGSLFGAAPTAKSGHTARTMVADATDIHEAPTDLVQPVTPTKSAAGTAAGRAT